MPNILKKLVNKAKNKLNLTKSGLIIYKFVCGHKHYEINVSEKIKLWECVKGKMRTGDSKPDTIFLTKTEPGKNPESVDGVSTNWAADRKNNRWKHIIKDIKTGKILHEEDMPLDQHK